MPRLWTETIETHRGAVRDAALATAASLVAQDGLRSVTMSRIAQETGIGRATLYKYFPDVEAILIEWHTRQIAHHLEHLAEVRDQAGTPTERLAAVLEAFALIAYARGQHEADIAATLHRSDQAEHAEQQVRHMISDLLAESMTTGDVRTDVAPVELAIYCSHALAAATSLGSEAAIRRLVAVTLDGLRGAPPT